MRRRIEWGRASWIVLAAACTTVDVVLDEPVVECSPVERADAHQAFAACVSQGQPRNLHVDDDTVDLAEWVKSCGEQARAVACSTVHYAERIETALLAPPERTGRARCDGNEPAWARAVCR